MPTRRTIRRSALRVQQHPEHPLYMFTLTGDELLRVADIWHASRDDSGSLDGYQRPEAKRHVREIAEYLDGDEVLFPNPIILALSTKASFKAKRVAAEQRPFAATGTLEIPVPRKGRKKPAWVVDGQQRMMALAKSQRSKDLVIPVNAFVADDVDVQREQFIRVNSSKPLPRGLLSELLPEVDGQLPDRLAARRLPSLLVDVLNQDVESPFFGLIWRSSLSKDAKRRTVVRDGVMIRMLEDRLNSPTGCLFAHQNIATGTYDLDSIRRTLFVYWSAVRDTFPDAWGKKPKESRLMHGAGIRGMGRLMDRVMSGIDPTRPKAAAQVRRELRKIRRVCRWTGGYWEGVGLRWFEIQNTPSHVRRLGDFLVDAYLSS